MDDRFPERSPFRVGSGKLGMSHLTRPEFTCRFHWTPGALAFWDNRCVQHYPINDIRGHRREMHRLTLVGDPTV